MSRLRGKGPKISLNRPQTTPEPPVVPPNLEKHTTITIDNETFEIEADDLEVISQLGKTCLDTYLGCKVSVHIILQVGELMALSKR